MERWEMGICLNTVCTGVEPTVHCLLREKRREVGTHTENLVGYIIKVPGIWTEHLKCDFMWNSSFYVSFLIVLNSFRRNLCLAQGK